MSNCLFLTFCRFWFINKTYIFRQILFMIYTTSRTYFHLDDYMVLIYEYAYTDLNFVVDNLEF